jgi:hypothetical protein
VGGYILGYLTPKEAGYLPPWGTYPKVSNLLGGEVIQGKNISCYTCISFLMRKPGSKVLSPNNRKYGKTVYMTHEI